MNKIIEQLKQLFRSKELTFEEQKHVCALRLSYNNFDERWNLDKDFYGECKR